MFDSTSFKLISGFLGLLILGFLVFIIAGTSHISDSSSEVSSVQSK
ncbi:MAG: hypothetical protein K9M11_04335 [Candidatus Pacebacteria bacterium]|nr:hypothetical protein [Candidatus Paceibacterota bacterium]